MITSPLSINKQGLSVYRQLGAMSSLDFARYPSMV